MSLDMLPNELTINILHYLSFEDLLHVSTQNKKLDELVELINKIHFTNLIKAQLENAEILDLLPVDLYVYYKGLHSSISMFTKNYDVRFKQDWQIMALIPGITQIDDSYIYNSNKTLFYIDEAGRNSLHYAAWIGNTALVKFLLHKFPLLNILDNEKLNICHYALMSGNFLLFKSLKEKFPDLKSRTLQGKTFLHCAATNEAFKTSEDLKEIEPDLYSTDNEGCNVLHFAALRGNLPLINNLLKNHPELNISDKKGRLPLHYAAMSTPFKTSDSLSIIGSTLYLTDNFGRNILHFAALGGNIPLIIDLLKSHPELNISDKKGRFPIHYAAIGGNSKTVKTLLDNKSEVCHDDFGYNFFHYVLIYCSGEFILKLLDEKIIINLIKKPQSRDNGFFYLSYALKNDHVDIFKKIVEINRALIYQRSSKDGQTIIHLAALYGFIDHVKYIIDILPGIINSIDNEKATPLHFAALSGNKELVVYLLSLNKLAFDIVDMHGNNILHYAVKSGCVDLVEYLLNLYPILEVINEERQNILQIAILNNQLGLTEYLLKNRFDFYKKDQDITELSYFEISLKTQNFALVKLVFPYLSLTNNQIKLILNETKMSEEIKEYLINFCQNQAQAEKNSLFSLFDHIDLTSLNEDNLTKFDNWIINHNNQHNSSSSSEFAFLKHSLHWKIKQLFYDFIEEFNETENLSTERLNFYSQTISAYKNDVKITTTNEINKLFLIKFSDLLHSLKKVNKTNQSTQQITNENYSIFNP